MHNIIAMRCHKGWRIGTKAWILKNVQIAISRFKVKFIYSEKATKFCKISTVDLSYVVPVKSTVEISQNFVALSE